MTTSGDHVLCLQKRPTDTRKNRREHHFDPIAIQDANSFN
jgi:hypothetical protein